MKLFNKFIYIAVILLINTQSYSAGKFKLAKVNNQTDKILVIYRGKQKPGLVEYRIEPNSTMEINRTVLSIEKSWTIRRLDFVIESELSNKIIGRKNCAIKIVNNSIILCPVILFDSTDFIARESVDLNYDYSISFVIKPNYEIQMHVIQE